MDFKYLTWSPENGKIEVVAQGQEINPDPSTRVQILSLVNEKSKRGHN